MYEVCIIFFFFHITDQMKDVVIAKLCAQCAEYYSDTIKIMQKDFVRPLVGSSWISLVGRILIKIQFFLIHF